MKYRNLAFGFAFIRCDLIKLTRVSPSEHVLQLGSKSSSSEEEKEKP